MKTFLPSTLLLAALLISCAEKELFIDFPAPPENELFAFGALGHGLPSCFQIYAIQEVDASFLTYDEVADATVTVYRNDSVWMEIVDAGQSANCDGDNHKTNLYYFQSFRSGNCYCTLAETFLNEAAEYRVEISKAGYNTVVSAPFSFTDKLAQPELELNLIVTPNGTHYYDAPLLSAEARVPDFHIRHATYAFLDSNGDSTIDNVVKASRDRSYNVNANFIEIQPDLLQGDRYDTGLDTCTRFLSAPPPFDTVLITNARCFISPKAYKTYLLSLTSEYNQFWQLRAESSSPELGGFLLDNPRGISNMSNGFGYITTAELDSAVVEL